MPVRNPDDKDVENDPEFWQCDRCKQWFHEHFDIMRPRAGRWFEELPTGDVTLHEQVCEDCHRVLTHRNRGA